MAFEPGAVRVGGTPNLSLVGQGHAQPRPFPLDGDCALFYSARYALFHGLAAVGLAPGDTVLVPSYCCGTELDPLLRFGLRFRFYDLDERLRPDVGSLRARWEPGVRALLVIHYFGFDCLTDEVDALRRERGALLLEDCAHALLSRSEQGAPLGARGELAVFSLRKTLGIPDGGALRVAGRVLPRPGKAPNRWSIFYRAAELLAETSTPRAGALAWSAVRSSVRSSARLAGQSKRGFYAARRLLHRGDDALIHPNDYVFHANAAQWGISGFSRRRLAGQDWEGIVASRRRNYAFLLEAVKRAGLRPLLPDLPAKVCPLFLPLVVEDRQRLHARLWDQGIDSHLWWGFFHSSVPWAEHPHAAELKRTVLGLHVHQDLRDEHLEAMARALGEAR